VWPLGCGNQDGLRLPYLYRLLVGAGSWEKLTSYLLRKRFGTVGKYWWQTSSNGTVTVSFTAFDNAATHNAVVNHDREGYVDASYSLRGTVIEGRNSPRY